MRPGIVVLKYGIEGTLLGGAFSGESIFTILENRADLSSSQAYDGLFSKPE